MSRLATAAASGATRDLLRRSWQSWLSNELAHEGPWWLMWLWTILFCTALAVVFTVVSALAAAPEDALASLPLWATWFARNWPVCMTIGALIHLLFAGAARVIAPQRIRGWAPWQRTMFSSGLPMLGLAVGWPLGILLAGGDLFEWFTSNSGVRSVALSLAIGLLIVFATHDLYAARSRQVDAERRATEAQLRLLQAQMEPHFLFNTLANVQGLIDDDPARAKLMLETFTDYLRSTLTQLRTGAGTLGDELALAETYLKLQQMRMADRLDYRIDADDGARAAALSPLVLQPLVENAIRHGLEPKVEGGSLALRARTDGSRLTVEVADDGLGLDARPRPRHAPGRRRRCLVLPLRREVHLRPDGRRRVPDPHPDRRARRHARRADLRPGPSLDDRQPAAPRGGAARRGEPAVPARQGLPARTRGQPRVRPPVQGHVTRRRGGSALPRRARRAQAAERALLAARRGVSARAARAAARLRSGTPRRS